MRIQQCEGDSTKLKSSDETVVAHQQYTKYQINAGEGDDQKVETVLNFLPVFNYKSGRAIKTREEHASCKFVTF